MTGDERPSAGRQVQLTSIGALLVLPLALYSDVLDPRRAFYYRDILAYWYAQASGFVACIAGGSWPLWNPYVGFGSPMLADAGYEAAYPFTWLNLVLLPATYYKALALSHTAFTGVGCYLLARRLGVSPVSGLLAGGLWAASGPLQSTLSVNLHFVGAAWMPWVLHGVERVLSRPSRSRTALLALAAAMQLLSGSGEMCLMTAIAAAIRCGAQILAPSDERAPVLRRTLPSLAFAAALAFAVAAVQWIPTLSLALASGRSSMGAWALGFWSAHPLSLLDVVYPRLLADAPLSAGGREVLFEAREPFLVSPCLSIVGWPLVAFGLRRPGRLRSFAGIAAALFLMLALGRFTPLQPALQRLPPFSLMRYPVKYLVPFALTWSLLAAWGLEEWRAEGTSRRLWLPAGATLALVAASVLLLSVAQNGLAAPLDMRPLLQDSSEARLEFAAAAGMRATSAVIVAGCVLLLILLRLRESGDIGWSALLLVGLSLAEAVRVGRTANPVGPIELVNQVPPAVAHLQSARKDERLWSMGYGRDFLAGQLAHGPSGWNVDERWMLGLVETLRPPIAARFGVYGSYDGDFVGLRPPAVSAVAGLVARHAGSPFGLRLLQLGNVGNVVTLDAAALPGLRDAAPPQPSVYKLPIRVLRVPDPLPRVYAVPGVVVAQEPDAYLRLADPGFDPRRQVLLDLGAAAPSAADFRAAVRILDRAADRVSIAAELNRDGVVVLVEGYDTGWIATIDDRPMPVLRANLLFRGMRVPAGRHRLELRYRPTSVFAGLLLSATGLVACGLLVRQRR